MGRVSKGLVMKAKIAPKAEEVSTSQGLSENISNIVA